MKALVRLSESTSTKKSMSAWKTPSVPVPAAPMVRVRNTPATTPNSSAGIWTRNVKNILRFTDTKVFAMFSRAKTNVRFTIYISLVFGMFDKRT